MIKYFSMFSGIGGFELGIKQAMPDAKCIGISEIDKWAVSIYQKHFKGHKNYGNATKINPSEIPDFDILVGGFPCQAFSIAGKRGGFSDTRGTLFFEIARVLREKQPRFLVLENVKGLLSHDQGNSANIIMSELDELGYNCQWNVCNSKNYGVPQNRQRIFIVGHLRTDGHRARQIFSIRKSRSKNTQEPKLLQLVGGAQGNRVYDSRGIAVTQSVLGGGGGAKTGLYYIDSRIRKLMPVECERLQGFPDDWTKYGVDGETISDTQRYKCCGNAVTVNVVADIFKKIADYEK